MVDVQRNMAKDNDVVMEGRDITTVVFPNANYKFYLDASIDARAERRYKQNQEIPFDEGFFLLEGEARSRFRKWDNVKYIAETPRSGIKAKKSYTNKNWGMEIKTNNRLDPKDGVGIRFGVVVTLKEINGVNRIDEFIKNCTLNGWLVNRIDVKERIDINKKINEEIELE